MGLSWTWYPSVGFKKEHREETPREFEKSGSESSGPGPHFSDLWAFALGADAEDLKDGARASWPGGAVGSMGVRFALVWPGTLPQVLC